MKKIIAFIMSCAIVGSVSSSTLYASSIKEPVDILVWEESENETRSVTDYFEWVETNRKYVYGYKNSNVIWRQHLISYVWENLSDQKKAKATATNYTYDSSNNNYIYGWTSDDECYSRARIESAIGVVYEDSGKKFARYYCNAETSNPTIGIARTYCGNLAAD